MKKYLLFLSLIIIGVLSIVFFKYYSDEINEKNKTLTTRNSLISQKKESLKTEDLDILLDGSIHSSGEWLLRNQKADGSFNYERDVTTGEITDSENNIVRQSGTLYGVAKLYNYTKDTRYKETLLKGFNYFDTLAETKDLEGTTVRYFKEGGSVQANTVALQILAYLELAKADRDLPSDLSTKLEEMVNFIKLSQQSNGAFQNYFLNKIKIECWESDYNNGESFFALTSYYKYSSDETLRPLLEISANYFLEKYKDFNIEFYSRGMMGFSQLYEITGNTNYRDYIYQNTDNMINVAGTNFLGIGAYLKSTNEANPLPDYSQIVQTEGLLYVYKIAVMDNPEKASTYKNAIINSLAFHAVFQSPWEETLPNRIYDVVKGGFCNRSDCSIQRIDMVHHALSAFIDALNFIDNSNLQLSVANSINTK